LPVVAMDFLTPDPWSFTSRHDGLVG
jgi:hypothetical protein